MNAEYYPHRPVVNRTPDRMKSPEALHYAVFDQKPRYRMTLMKAEILLRGSADKLLRDFTGWFPDLVQDIKNRYVAVGVMTKGVIGYVMAYADDRNALRELRERWHEPLTALQICFQRRVIDFTKGYRLGWMDYPSKHEEFVKKFFRYRVELSKDFPDFVRFDIGSTGPYYFTAHPNSKAVITTPGSYGARLHLYCSNAVDAFTARMMELGAKMDRAS